MISFFFPSSLSLLIGGRVSERFINGYKITYKITFIWNIKEKEALEKIKTDGTKIN